MKKLSCFILFIIVIVLIFTITIFTPKSYEYNYKVNNITITERFERKNSVYYFTFNDGHENYKYSLKSKYVRERGLIDTVRIKSGCLSTQSLAIDSFSICKNNEEYYTTFYARDFNSKILDTYENVDIYNLLGKKIYVWNYGEFLYFHNNQREKISLFANDVYELDLVVMLNNYLIVPNYNQKYKFNEMYLINSKNNKVKLIKFNRDIYYNSYILGTYKKDIYIYDIQQEIEYRLNPFKEDIDKYRYEIRVNDSWQKVSVNKLNKKEVRFDKTEIFEYYLLDNQLIYKTPNVHIKVTDLKVNNIVFSDYDEVFFIAGDSLYYANISSVFI